MDAGESSPCSTNSPVNPPNVHPGSIVPVHILPPPGLSHLELDISFAGDLPDLEIKYRVPGCTPPKGILIIDIFSYDSGATFEV